MSELERILKEEQEEIKRQDRKMKLKGFTHRLTWWNHKSRGDDTQQDAYIMTKDPTFYIKNIEEHGITEIRRGVKGNASAKGMYNLINKAYTQSLKKDYQFIPL